MKIKNLIFKCIVFFFLRLPFWEALSVLMVFGEMELNLNKKKIQVPNSIIYIDMGILVLLGTFMAFSPMYRRQTAKFAAVHMAVHCFLEANLVYLQQPLFYRVLSRNLGIIAAYLLVAAGFGENKKAKSSRLIDASCFVLGAMFLFQAYLLVATKDEHNLLRKLFSSLKLDSKIYQFVIIPGLTLCLVAASVTFFLRSQALKIAQLFALVYTICILFPTDVIIGFKFKPVIFWTCYRLVISSLTTISCLVILSF